VGVAERDAGKTVRRLASFGCDAADVDRLDISWAETDRGNGPSGTAIRTGVTQLNRNTQANPALAPWREWNRHYNYRSSVALPLSERPGPGAFGVLCIYATAPDAFDVEEVGLLEELAGSVTYGLTSRRIARERSAGVERLRQVMESAVETIAATVEARDPYTAGHQQRVARLAEAIGRELRLDDETVRGLHFGALIHDVGKIQVPAELLAKPAHLTNLEFELIKTHAQVGYDILKGIEFPWPVAQMIVQHHERLDGSGYPNGLTGDQMILESRILAVADVVEAMSSHRPYRPTRGIKMALAEIEAGRGRLYDAAAVDACLSLFRNKTFSFTSPEPVS